jgi:hypothetical protein
MMETSRLEDSDELKHAIALIRASSHYEFKAEVAKFKHNQNKMKTMLIEENRRQKEIIQAAILESRQTLEYNLNKLQTKVSNFEKRVQTTIKKLNVRSKEIVKKGTDMLKEEFPETELAAICVEVKTKMEEKYGSFIEKRIGMEEELRNELEDAIGKEKKAAANQRRTYKKNLKALYEKEKRTVEKTILAANQFEEACETVAERLGDQVGGMIQSYVNRAVYAESIKISKDLMSIRRHIAQLEGRPEDVKEEEKVTSSLIRLFNHKGQETDTYLLVESEVD